MSASLGLKRRPVSFRAASRLGAVLLALSLVCVASGSAASVPSAAYLASATNRVHIPVGALAYSHGAGSQTWNLRTHAAWAARVIEHRYDVGTVYGYRSSTTSDHGSGLAADFMVYSRTHKGRHVARFARKHHEQLNVTYVLWKQRIWSVARASEGWRPMADAGSATANHQNHVHVSFLETPGDDTYRR